MEDKQKRQENCIKHEIFFDSFDSFPKNGNSRKFYEFRLDESFIDKIIHNIVYTIR